MAEGTVFRDIYNLMLRTRFLEEALTEEFKKGTTFGPLHLCVGQEAAGVAAGKALRPEDVICTTHRGHAHYIGRGVELKRLCCEIWGKEEGYGKGRAGHMIVFDKEHGVLGGSGIVGGGISIAVGQALGFQMRGEKRVAAAFFGDGASNTGSFHESLNMAAKWKLPIVFFLENNRYGLTVHIDDHCSVEDLAVRAKAYRIEGVQVFGNDMVKVYDTVKDAAETVRAGNGPILIEAKTYRMHGFSTTDAGGYQKEDEMAYWRERDPIRLAEEYLLKEEICSEEEIKTFREKAFGDVQEAVEYALMSPYPESVELPADLFKEPQHG